MDHSIGEAGGWKVRIGDDDCIRVAHCVEMHKELAAEKRVDSIQHSSFLSFSTSQWCDGVRSQHFRRQRTVHDCRSLPMCCQSACTRPTRFTLMPMRSSIAAFATSALSAVSASGA